MPRNPTARLLRLAPVQWQRAADRMTPDQRAQAIRDLEGIAEHAAMLAAYLDKRHGSGCGDQGHSQALRAANRAGRIVWQDAFGYNAHHALSV